MTRTLLSLALAAGLALSAAPLAAQPTALAGTQAVAVAAAAVSAPDPARQLQDMAAMFRNGDLAALAEASLPPAQWEELRLAYELFRIQPLSDEDRAEFAEGLDRLLAPNAVDELMARIEPEVEKFRPQYPGALLMALGGLQFAIESPESELTEEQRASLRAAQPALAAWMQGTDFLDTATIRRALTMVADAARRTGIIDLEQLRAMPLEQVLDTARPVFAAAKDAVRLYGIDVDAIADSLQVEVLAIDGDTARVRSTVTVFDAPFSHEHELVLVDGRWYGKQAMIQFRDRDHDHLDIDVDVDVDTDGDGGVKS